MKILLRTADKLELFVEVQKFSMEIKRPILKPFYVEGEKSGMTVIGVRIYNYIGTQLDGTPIYEEYWYANSDNEDR